jgi:hypothetical protein
MIDYKLNKNDRAILKQYEVHLQRAKDGYVRGIYSTDLDTIEPIYSKFGLHLENKHCSTCVLSMLKFLENKYNSK